MPFYNEQGDGPARVVLEQVDDTHFKIGTAFKYVDPTTQKEYLVPASDPDDPHDVTDLASVPWILWWLVASYGQHTRAALLHDQLVSDGMSLEQRVEADSVFFRALEESGNNWLRHRLMWAAVSVGGTMLKCTAIRGVLFFLHVLAFWLAVLWSIGALAWLQRQPWLSWVPYLDQAPFDDYHLWLGVGALVMFLSGFLWRPAPTADPRLAWWMWGVVALGTALIVAPCALIALSVRVVQAIDYTVAIVKWLARRGWERPAPVRPTARPVALGVPEQM
jgi:uncharacterized protein DUF1353